MSNYSLFDRDHIKNCSICRSSGSDQYLSKYERYLKIIQNEISLLSLSYQARMKLEHTIEDVLKSMYLSLKTSEPYLPSDYRTDQYLEIESRYEILFLEFEEEKKSRLRAETEKNLLERKTANLIETQKECLSSHLSSSKAKELYSEIDRGKGIIKELEEEVKELIEEISIMRAKIRDYERDSSSFTILKKELEEKDKRYLQVLKELGCYQDLYEEVCKDSNEISSSFRNFKDSDYINKKYENALKENQQLIDQIKQLKQENAQLLKIQKDQSYFSPVSNRLEKTDHINIQYNKNQYRSPNTQSLNQSPDCTHQSGYKTPSENLSSPNKNHVTDWLIDLEKKIDELKEKIESKQDPQNRWLEIKLDELREKIDQKNEKSFGYLTGSTNLNQSGYNTFTNDKMRSGELTESNGHISKLSPQRRSSKKGQTEVPQNRRRSSEFNLTFTSHIRRNSSTHRNESLNPAIPHCEICQRKHGEKKLIKQV